MIILDPTHAEECRKLRDEIYVEKTEHPKWDEMVALSEEIKKEYKVEKNWLLDAKCGILFSPDDHREGIGKLHNHNG